MGQISKSLQREGVSRERASGPKVLKFLLSHAHLLDFFLADVGSEYTEIYL